LARPGTVGRVEDGQVVVLDDDDEVLPPGEPGTVYVRAPDIGRFRYHGDDARTASVYRGDYYTFGDTGYLDEDSWLFLTERHTDLIISGGVDVHPAEVEAALLGHPAVADVAVIGVPDREWGEQIKAVVELHPAYAPRDALADDLVAFARERLAGYKCPRSVTFVERLPRADDGKLSKHLLRERFAKPHVT
jgi:long-chain acyl-CoA synthetase